MKKPAKFILLIDYYLGNHESIINALSFLGATVVVGNDYNLIRKASAYILPGVGAFKEAMKNIRQLKLKEKLEPEVFQRRKPLLGICLGMQILAQSSEEDGYCEGLGWLEAQVIKIKAVNTLSIPHVGWNNITIYNSNPIFKTIKNQTNYYFDHSYHLVVNENKEPGVIAAKFSYGQTMIAAIQKNNLFGVQFHPEKSQNNGLRLYRNFLNLN